MKIVLPERIAAVIETLGNKTKRQSAMKVYAAMYMRSNRTDKHGYFDCPSTYLQAINSRYATIVEEFIRSGVLKRKEKLTIDPNDIFKTIKSPVYSSQLGYCIKYKFLVDVECGREIEINFDSGKYRRWYQVLQASLIELGHPPKITRDNFGRRVYHPAIKNYKTALANKGLCVIDAKASQPTLLWLLMKERGYQDYYYNSIFENKLDFYAQIASDLQLNSREKAKKLFMLWANSENKATYTELRQLFPVAGSFIEYLKSNNYKDSPAFLQRHEAYVWIDNLLDKIPVEFAIPVHDSLIVKKEDLKVVLDYCQSKYPQIQFETKPL